MYMLLTVDISDIMRRYTSLSIAFQRHLSSPPLCTLLPPSLSPPLSFIFSLSPAVPPFPHIFSLHHTFSPSLIQPTPSAQMLCGWPQSPRDALWVAPVSQRCSVGGASLPEMPCGWRQSPRDALWVVP